MRVERPHVEELNQQLDWKVSDGSIEIGRRQLALDLRNRHERNYFLHHHFNCVAPSIELDLRLFDRFLRRGDSFLDAGANIGFTALAALARGAGLVAAIEPEPNLAERLAALASPDLEVHAVALGAEDGEAELVLSSTHNQGHTLSEGMLEFFPAVFTDAERVRVPIRRLDTLFPERRFDVWKVDIEGVEPQFLDGAAGHLTTAAPRILMIEIYPPTFEATLERLTRAFQVVRRAALRREDDELVLLPASAGTLDDTFWPAPPTYVAGNREMFSDI